MGKEYCVYVHTNKTNGKKYVGITCQKPQRRWGDGRNYRFNQHFYGAIKKYGWDGFSHEILMSGLSKSQADKMERMLIAQWDCTNHEKGYNSSLGGDGHESFSAQTKERMSKSAKRRFEDPEELRKNQARGLLQFSTAEAIEKDRQAQLKYHEMNPRARYQKARLINQYDLDGHFVKQWKSIADAKRVFGGAIIAVCKNEYRRKSAGGYMWRYADIVGNTKDIKPVHYGDCWRAVNQYSLDGVFIRQWKGLSAAEKALNIRNVSEVCNGHRGKAAGYIWRFADLEDRKQIEPYRRNKNGTQNNAI